jgi:tRNA pseudouridine38-40 synthase
LTIIVNSPSTRHLKLTLAYDGTAYHGWQVQLQQPTIQLALETAWHAVTGETRRITASGRTDSGVHAWGQVASLETASVLDCTTLRKALDARTPHDIAVLAVDEAPAGFHAIRDCTSKRYRYVLQDGPVPNLFLRWYAWRVREMLDHWAMHRAAQQLLGKHDFSSFEASGSERATSVRTIRDIQVGRISSEPTGLLHFEVEADGFLYNMVRNLIGSLVEVGQGKRPESWLSEVLAAQDRRAAGTTAPPQGLFLLRVDYDG